MVVELKPHQRPAVEKLSNGKVLVGGVGSGKTPTALVYFYEKVMGGTLGDPGSIKTPMDIYVFTTARKRESLDWQKWGAELAISREREASIHGIQLTVDSYNNIGKYTHVHGAFLIFDEQRFVGSGAWSKAFLHMAKSNQWIMLSATPADKWEDYIPLFLANGFYKNRTAFKREHCVYSYYGSFPKLENYMGVGRLVRLRDSILVQMPYARHTTRHIHEVIVDYDKDLLDQVVKHRWHVYENRPLRDVAEFFSVMRKVVNSDLSRLEVIRGLLSSTHPRLIVFYNFDYELEMLRSLGTQTGLLDSMGNPLELSQQSRESLSLTTSEPWEISSTSSTTRKSRPTSAQSVSRRSPRPLSGLTEAPLRPSTKTSDAESTQGSRLIGSGMEGANPTSLGMTSSGQLNKSNGPETFQIAEWNGHKHEEVPTSDRWVYLVQYAAGAEAWNCTATDAMVFYSLSYSYRHFQQAQGRIDRLNTPYRDLHYYVLNSKSPIDVAIAKALKSKKSFNEKSYST